LLFVIVANYSNNIPSWMILILKNVLNWLFEKEKPFLGIQFEIVCWQFDIR